NTMKRINWLIALVVFGTTTMLSQQTDPIATGLGGVATIVGETKTPEVPQEAAPTASPAVERPAWKDKLYYGYNFDIYYHYDTRSNTKENGWSLSVEPEIGWRLKEKLYMGLRFGGSYQDAYLTYSVYDMIEGNDKPEELRVQQGTWNVTPYMRYRLKTMFDEKVGIWLEAHAYAGMEFPRVTDGVVKGTDYDGLRHTITYGVQVSPVITYQFNKKSTFQIFFSILSLGYSGSTFCYTDPLTGDRYNEQTNDVIVFSGKLRNLIANQFTPGLYGLKFGVQKSF
ncbi:MAG: hypothetical protein IJT12_03795, partial [Paludibacteraceae bacterium]|nr:hypothetical protein [Paludibacteraceae bacterium]